MKRDDDYEWFGPLHLRFRFSTHDCGFGITLKHYAPNTGMGSEPVHATDEEEWFWKALKRERAKNRGVKR